jgi:hypothetical protein
VKRTLTIIGLGVAGIVLAVALSVGAFALVGDSLSEPATTIEIPASPTTTPTGDRGTPSPTSKPSTRSETPSGPPSSSASPSDDHGASDSGGGSGSEPSDDHGGDGAGHGSDD